MSTDRISNLPRIGGPALGVGAWVVGYLLTFVVVAPNVRDSSINQLLEAFDGTLPTFDIVGWVFFNAHFVDTLVQGLLSSEESAVSFIGSDGGFTILLYAVPAALLVAVGLALARYQAVTKPRKGFLVGLTILPSYAVLSVVGAWLFDVSTLGVIVAPDIVMAFVIAGLLYPLVFAGAGGAIGGFLVGRAASGPSGDPL